MVTAGPRYHGWKWDGSRLGVQIGETEVFDLDANDIVFAQNSTFSGTLGVTGALTQTGLATFVTKITAELGIFDADMIVDSTNQMTFQIGGTDILALDDAAISGFAGDAATAGQALFLQTEDGGVASASVGLAGGALDIRSGDGSAGNASTNKGGAGGGITIVAGAAGAGVSTADGADGGDIAITAGNAVDTSGGTNDGSGGNVTITMGTSSGNGTGNAGALVLVIPSEFVSTSEPSTLPSNGIWVDSDDARTIKHKA